MNPVEILRIKPAPKHGVMKIYSFPLKADGSVGKRRTIVDFGDEKGCDGMTVDAVGHVYLVLVVSLLFVIFRCADLETAGVYLGGMFEGWSGPGTARTLDPAWLLLLLAFGTVHTGAYVGMFGRRP